MLRGKFLRLLNSEVLHFKNLVRLLILREALSSGVDGYWLTGRQNCRKTVELYLKRGTNSVKKKKKTVYLGRKPKVIRVGVGERGLINVIFCFSQQGVPTTVFVKYLFG